MTNIINKNDDLKFIDNAFYNWYTIHSIYNNYSTDSKEVELMTSSYTLATDEATYKIPYDKQFINTPFSELKLDEQGLIDNVKFSNFIDENNQIYYFTKFP